MKKAISVKQKKRGRPATGFDPMVGVRLNADLIERLDRWSEHHGMTRSEAIRLHVENGIKHKGPRERK